MFTQRNQETTVIEGTLGIDISDGKSNEPVWHGWVTKMTGRLNTET